MAAAVRFGQHLKELRIHLCQKSSASKGVRDFIEKYYVDIKKSNQQLPILIRECSGVKPKVYARFEMGKESSVPLSDMNSERVLESINNLAK
ncbi:hypothetical protein SNE40_016842 [Patella caerulea]|uniref:NADH dehydrogenase [ubiquinone] 1 alpha subcomplex subunit 2 n=1 Tax=Patella caerulea TaxID=87958 RepID=A0AAN8JA15_PATCE